MQPRDLVIVAGLVCLIAMESFGQTCPNRLQLRTMPSTSRGGTIIYKANWNVKENREQTVAEGNHSQKGAALLVDYRAKQYLPNKSFLEVRTTSCKLVARFGRYPRCTNTGCGTWERWYLRAPGGSGLTVAGLEKVLGSKTAFIRLQGRLWAVVQNIYDDREIY